MTHTTLFRRLNPRYAHRYPLVCMLGLMSLAGTAAGAADLPPGLLGPQLVSTDIPVMTTRTVDHAALLAEDAAKPNGPGLSGPTRFAVTLEAAITPQSQGIWQTLDDDWHLWRTEIHSPGALSINLRLDTFDVPAGSRLWIHDPGGSHLQGPYTTADRVGGLSTPVVLSERIVVELVVPPGRQNDARIRITDINHGYRFFGEDHENAKQGSCNIDVICPEGDGWRDQIRSVARYTISGTGLCTGTLVNNTAEDDRPFFLTADHCGVTASNDHTLVVYWNYESPACGMLSGGSLTQNQRGSMMLSTWDWDSGSDFTLVELDAIPDASFDVYYSGWDASGDVPRSAVAIHQPHGDEKAISFDYDPLITIWGSHWKVIDWDEGTTEPGSSGSCIYDASNGLCVGTLSGGYAACGNDLEDWFGKVSVSWTGNGTPETRLSDHLDPTGSGVLKLQGKNPGGGSQTFVTWLIPAAASEPGIGDSNWKTQIGVPNPTTDSITVQAFFVERGAAWPGDQLGGDHTVPAGGALYLNDPLAGQNPTTGLMYVKVSSEDAIVSSRTYNLTADGKTYGQGIPGIRLDTAVAAPSLILPLILSDPSTYRANLGLVQTSQGSFSVEVTIFAPTGQALATKTYTQTAAYFQVNNLLNNMGIGSTVLEGGWIAVNLVSGSPAYWTAYASVVDNATDDPTYIIPVAH